MNIKQEFSFKGNEITISNNNLQSVSFQFNINNEFPILVKKEIDSIYKISKTLSIDTPKAAWHYVIQNTFPSKPFTLKPWCHNPNIFINSIASGYCDDLSSHLVLLWDKLGYKARVMGLEGHVIPEVYHNGKWELYDPDLRVYFYNANDEVAGLQEIENDTTCFKRISKEYENIFSFNTQLSNKFKSIYSSAYNNKENTDWQLNYKNDIDSFYTLPSHSSLSIYFDSTLNTNLACVSLSKKSRGILNIPLLPMVVAGSFNAILNDSLITINAVNNYLLDNFDKMRVQNVLQETKIYFLINPFVSIFKSSNEINSISSKNISLSISNQTSTLYSQEINYWLINKQLSRNRNNYFKIADLDTFRNLGLKNEYEKYCLILNKNEMNTNISIYNKEIENSLAISPKKLDSILISYYPVSTQIYNYSIANDNLDYLYSRLKYIQHE
ncbi:MAG: hypothetical protein KDE33_19955 [Bacteroidetes bacterium]|nr:hypothetical protein [Bacteroidota bacterium]MCB9225565.1 hypothetical protein [Chitinophagales bacterium]